MVSRLLPPTGARTTPFTTPVRIGDTEGTSSKDYVFLARKCGCVVCTGWGGCVPLLTGFGCAGLDCVLRAACSEALLGAVETRAVVSFRVVERDRLVREDRAGDGLAAACTRAAEGVRLRDDERRDI